MNSIQNQFEIIAAKHPLWSSYLCFAQLIRGRKLNQVMVHRWFNKLVEKDDYAPDEKRQVVAHLDTLYTPPMHCQKSGKIGKTRRVKNLGRVVARSLRENVKKIIIQHLASFEEKKPVAGLLTA